MIDVTRGLHYNKLQPGSHIRHHTTKVIITGNLPTLGLKSFNCSTRLPNALQRSFSASICARGVRLRTTLPLPGAFAATDRSTSWGEQDASRTSRNSALDLVAKAWASTGCTNDPTSSKPGAVVVAREVRARTGNPVGSEIVGAGRAGIVLVSYDGKVSRSDSML